MSACVRNERKWERCIQGEVCPLQAAAPHYALRCVSCICMYFITTERKMCRFLLNHISVKVKIS